MFDSANAVSDAGNSGKRDDVPLFTARDLRVSFKMGEKLLPIVKDVSFTLRRKETTCIVGESGCGKSVTALALMRLLPARDAIIEAEEFKLNNVDLLEYTEREMRKVRGGDIAMIFQDPMSALNPLLTVERQITEGVMLHTECTHEEACGLAIDVLEKVRIPDPKRMLEQYPFELSGGMRQRVMIAIALAMSPSLLIADEPTTALDTTVQAQVLTLIKDIQETLGLGIVLITHDFGVVAEVADQVAVMYAGQIVEYAAVTALFDNPSHPYTIGLMNALPMMGNNYSASGRLNEIPGMVPAPSDTVAGCAFASRCAHVTEQCRREKPKLRNAGANHLAACHLIEAS